MNVADGTLLAAAGLLAGGVNAIAGGGSLISFPAFLATGYPAVQANVTNTIALFPGYAGSVVGGRTELEGQGARARVTGIVGVVGAIGGAVLLLTTPGAVFQAVVPFLILMACALLVVQPRLAQAVQRRAASSDREEHHAPLLIVATLLASVYGAYFGAGLGVMLLGVLGIFLSERLQRVNALKNLLSLVINAVALLAFSLFGPVAWPAAAVVATTSLAGGYLGARVARRIPSAALRALVVAYGVVVAVVLLVRG
ncbi:MAG: sulfite exporter TauE/SafE family protein [Actinomycetota bacterium]|nr:sulfite exporter TauE/SafE family protein [Actinomycetota bacterium]